MNFLKSMSNNSEFRIIISEKVNDENPSNMYFVVEFETKYCRKDLKDKVKIEFIGGLMNRFDGVWPDKLEKLEPLHSSNPFTVDISRLSTFFILSFHFILGLSFSFLYNSLM